MGNRIEPVIQPLVMTGRLGLRSLLLLQQEKFLWVRWLHCIVLATKKTKAH